MKFRLLIPGNLLLQKVDKKGRTSIVSLLPLYTGWIQQPMSERNRR